MVATMTDYRLEVLTLLWDAPDGMTIPELLGHFARWQWPEVKEAAIELECESVVMRCGRNAISEGGHHTVESRLIAWKGWKP